MQRHTLYAKAASPVRCLNSFLDTTYLPFSFARWELPRAKNNTRIQWRELKIPFPARLPTRQERRSSWHLSQPITASWGWRRRAQPRSWALGESFPGRRRGQGVHPGATGPPPTPARAAPPGLPAAPYPRSAASCCGRRRG